MGGSSKKVTVGYKYYLGMHMVLCHGPIDFISQFKVDNRTAWTGFSSGGEVNINKPGLFGGEDREGGVQGKVDVLMGGPSQPKNGYLKARLGEDIPAFRGVVSAVLKQVYLGMNPYLKPWSFRAQRINVKGDGETQWYNEKAAIGEFKDAAIYIALDLSGSMNWGEQDVDSDPSRLDSAKEALGQVFDELAFSANSFNLDLAVVGWSDNSTQITRRSVDSEDLNEIKTWTNNLTADGSTDFESAVSYASTFFNGSGDKPRIFIFITDGEPSPVESADLASDTLFSIPEVSAYGMNILLGDTEQTAKMDNTPEDGVPVVSATNPNALRNAIMNALISHVDMNPAHIIRECLTDKVWGMGYLDTDVDDDSFQSAADTLFSEGMGISLVWDRQMEIQEFINEVIRHIDATIYVDRVTGKFTLKLIRDDYDAESLITLGPANIQKVTDYGRIDPGNSVNSVTVIYWDQKTGEDASVTADDIALIQSYGNVINTSVQYPGFTNAQIAGRAALRDLQALSFPLLNATIEADRTASGLNIGDTFKFEWPRNHEGYVIMRVNQISFGDGRKNRVKIVASEDVFALPNNGSTTEEESGWVEPGGPPLPPPTQIAFESPYLELIQEFGQTQVDTLLLETPEVGYLQVAANRPEDGINAQVWVDDGSGYDSGGPLDFSPTAKLVNSISLEDTTWDVQDMEDLDQVEIGTHGQIGEELFRVDSIDQESGVITVGRAILDSIPSEHSAGDSILFWDLYAFGDSTEYVSGENLGVRVLTNSSQGALELISANTENVIMDQRAYRPYRPAGLRAGGFLDPDPDWNPDYPVEITWVERNRKQETGGAFLSWTDPTITPEPGTDYEIIVEAIDDEGLVAGNITTVTQSGTTYSLEETTIGSTYAGFPFIRVSVYSRRDGLRSFKSPSVQFRGPFREPKNLQAVYRDLSAPENLEASLQL